MLESLFLLTAAKTISAPRDSSQKRLSLVTLPVSADSFCLGYTWQCESFIGTFAEVDLVMLRSTTLHLQEGLHSIGGDPWQKTEVRANFLESNVQHLSYWVRTLAVRLGTLLSNSN